MARRRKVEHEDERDEAAGLVAVLVGTCPTTLSQLGRGRGVAGCLRYGIPAANSGGCRAYRLWGFGRGTRWGAARGTGRYRWIPTLTSAVRRMLRGGRSALSLTVKRGLVISLPAYDYEEVVHKSYSPPSLYLPRLFVTREAISTRAERHPCPNTLLWYATTNTAGKRPRRHLFACRNDCPQEHGGSPDGCLELKHLARMACSWRRRKLAAAEVRLPGANGEATCLPVADGTMPCV